MCCVGFTLLQPSLPVAGVVSIVPARIFLVGAVGYSTSGVRRKETMTFTFNLIDSISYYFFL